LKTVMVFKTNIRGRKFVAGKLVQRGTGNLTFVKTPARADAVLRKRNALSIDARLVEILLLRDDVRQIHIQVDDTTYSITKNGFAQRCVIEDNNDGTQCYVDMDVFRRLAFYKTPHLPFETDIDEELRRLRNASA
jgi:hypothetical protein